MKLFRNLIVKLLLTSILLAGCQPAYSPQVDTAAATVKPITPTAAETVYKTPLVVFAAGSLIIPFAALEEAFEALYPQIDVMAEYHGSIQVMRHVTELYEPIDVVATADAALIPMLMYATNNPQTGSPYADWYIKFAGNKLALAYTNKSVYSDEINDQNWPEVLSRPDVRFGLADPRFDAAGYRALMAYALQENALKEYGLFKGMFKDQFTMPVSIFRDDDGTLIRVPEILETKNDSHILIRGASVFLIALMESGDLDYAFEYETVIRQHGLKMVSLPDEVSLGNNALLDFYNDVVVKLDFQRFSTVKPEFIAEPITYGITIPDSSMHPDEAALFIQFLLSEKGQAVMTANEHALFEEFTANGYEQVPVTLQAFCEAE